MVNLKEVFCAKKRISSEQSKGSSFVAAKQVREYSIGICYLRRSIFGISCGLAVRQFRDNFVVKVLGVIEALGL